jgi:hypothetical protein
VSDFIYQAFLAKISIIINSIIVYIPSRYSWKHHSPLKERRISRFLKQPQRQLLQGDDGGGAADAPKARTN